MELIELITRSNNLTTKALLNFVADEKDSALTKLVILRALLNRQPELGAGGALPTSKPRKEKL